jgi:hypothetical protein
MNTVTCWKFPYMYFLSNAKPINILLLDHLLIYIIRSIPLFLSFSLRTRSKYIYVPSLFPCFRNHVQIRLCLKGKIKKQTLVSEEATSRMPITFEKTK